MKIPVHNPNDHPIYVGTSMILPGETRHFDKHELPKHQWPKEDGEAVETQPADLVADLLKLTVREVVEAFSGISGDDLNRLESLENASPSPRKTLLAALVEERLKRAASEEDAGSSTGDGAPAEEAAPEQAAAAEAAPADPGQQD